MVINRSKALNIASFFLLVLTIMIFFLIPSFELIERTMQKTQEIYSVFRNWLNLKAETVIYATSGKTEEDKKRFIHHVTVFDKTVEYLLDEEILADIEKNYSYVKESQAIFLRKWQDIQFKLVLVVGGSGSIEDFATTILYMISNTAEFDVMLESLMDSSSNLNKAYFKKYIVSVYTLSIVVLIAFFLFLLKNIEYIYAKKAENKIRSISQSLDSIRDMERKRISLDLHDSLVQKLAALKSRCLESYYNGKNIKAVFRSVRTGLDAVIDLTREISFNLRPVELSGNYFDAVRCFLADFSQKSGIEISFINHGFNRLELAEETEISLFRMIQEILNNAEKHSMARHISIKFIYSFPYIILNVEDDGIGISDISMLSREAGKKHMGLKGIRDRVDLLNGTFRIKTSDKNGVKIFIKIPYEVKRDVK